MLSYVFLTSNVHDPEQPRAQCDGGGSWMAYASLGAMGISK